MDFESMVGFETIPQQNCQDSESGIILFTFDVIIFLLICTSIPSICRYNYHLVLTWF